MIDVVICHGTGGSPEGNWFPWLKERIEQKGKQVCVPKLPTPENQNRDSWMYAYVSQVSALADDAALVGHSCGASFLLHVLEGAQTPFAKTLFVSPVMGALGFPDFDVLNKSFYERDFDWERIRHNAGQVLIMHGDNDPYVPLAHAQKLQSLIGGALEVVANGGHINAESGYLELPRALAFVGA